MPKRILLIGGPSTGKTTLLKHLKQLGHPCLEEISRQVIQKAQNQGIDQLFLEKPLLFSELLKDARIDQWQQAVEYKNENVFIDRGIPDTVAYMDYIGQVYPDTFIEACTRYRYDSVFILPPWKEIHVTDSERYESFEEATKIQLHLLKTYKDYGYHPVEIPIGSIEERGDFIVNAIRN
ncbi:AAA family ATPase [Dokdonia sp. Hel_I_53]|uniref:AAA family ATPase n=1 Tax=Dokdonia sp. Hel_I_53 TaxID=1566287 RepID=UPI001199386C|nr:ATP-binding protein [Dokdonia sp. Hel_I_53]TVZ51807.1 putative ATPase [Dokdonia sp. Hel_I_53]